MKTKIEKYLSASSAMLATGMAWAFTSAFGEFFLCLISIVTDKVWNFQLYYNGFARVIFMSYFEFGKNYLWNSNPAYYCTMYSIVSMVQAVFLLPRKRNDCEEKIPGAEQFAWLAVISTFYHSFFYLCPYWIEDHIFVFKHYLL